MTFFCDHPDRIASFRDGERETLGLVYRFYVRRIDRYLRTLARSCGRTELAQPSAIADLLQESFVRAFSQGARQSYDASRPYSAYLHVVARNCFNDTLRLRRREVLAGTEDLPLETSEPSPMAESLNDPRLLAVLESYLSSLPPPLHGVYEQRFALGLSQQEACRILGLTRRKLRTGEERLRSGLRKALRGAGVPQDELGAPMVKIFRPSAR